MVNLIFIKFLFVEFYLIFIHYVFNSIIYRNITHNYSIYRLPIEQHQSDSRDIKLSTEHLRDVKNRHDILLRIRANSDKRIQRQSRNID